MTEPSGSLQQGPVFTVNEYQFIARNSDRCLIRGTARFGASAVLWKLGVGLAAAAGFALCPRDAAANCMLMSLGSGMSLMSCSDGTTGNAVSVGNGLVLYRLIGGTTKMLNLGTQSTSAGANASGSSGNAGSVTGIACGASATTSKATTSTGAANSTASAGATASATGVASPFSPSLTGPVPSPNGGFGCITPVPPSTTAAASAAPVPSTLSAAPAAPATPTTTIPVVPPVLSSASYGFGPDLAPPPSYNGNPDPSPAPGYSGNPDLSPPPYFGGTPAPPANGGVAIFYLVNGSVTPPPTGAAALQQSNAGSAAGALIPSLNTAISSSPGSGIPDIANSGIAARKTSGRGAAATSIASNRPNYSSAPPANGGRATTASVPSPYAPPNYGSVSSASAGANPTVMPPNYGSAPSGSTSNSSGMSSFALSGGLPSGSGGPVANSGYGN